MTDYTPTTEEVREIYRGCLVQTETNIYSFVDEAQADAEFDRFIEDIKTQERLRIFNELNRVTLVDDDRGGIQYERHGITVDHSIQDNGKTLKLFIKE